MRRSSWRCDCTMLVVLFVILVGGCEASRSPVSPLPPVVTAIVSEDVARSLDANGRFVLPAPEAPDSSPIISEIRARQLAAAYLQSFGIFHAQTWARQRGARIDLAELTVGPRVYFATTPYGPVPAGLHPSAKKLFGPFYIVPLYERGSLALVLAVSAYNVDMEISADGELTLPRFDGNGFIGSGIPAQNSGQAAISAEEAATQVARVAKRKVALVPELVLPGVGVMPVFALWKVTLESDVGVTRKSGEVREQAHEIFFGRFRPDEMLAPVRNQRTEETRTKLTVDSQGRLGPDVTYRVRVLAGRVAEFDAITVKP